LSATGVVSSRAERLRAIQQVLDAARESGLHAQKITESPIKGTNGNVEYLALFGNQRLDYAQEQSNLDQLFVKES
jgi:23S rRNA (cytidine1920-2'-O)/16S rRNA (cytidine1409-2'-O)-methyltransferase